MTTPEELMRELKQARGELKRLRYLSFEKVLTKSFNQKAKNLF